MAVRECMLSTSDNPYNPYKNFDEWYAFDVSHGYNSCAYLARISTTSIYLSDEEQLEEINLAIDDILKYNLTGNYIKVFKDESA